MSIEDNIEKFRRAVDWHEFEYEDRELVGLADGDLLHNYRWIQSQIRDTVEERNKAYNKKEKKEIQNYLNHLWTYLNKLQKEFDRRKLDIPE